MIKVVGIRFKRACKVNEYECGEHLKLLPGDFVIVEVEKGLGMGTVAYTPKEPPPQTKPRLLKKVIRKADDADMERLKFNARREKESLAVCTKKIKTYGLPMKLVRAEYLFDSSKAIFYFTSDSRVDFRRLVKDLASYFHTRIEMRQIGVRDEAKMLGGIGPCGRELCCSSFLPDFTPVTIKMAKQQNLALNPAKISGVCGRLMCCLSYEHEGYSNSQGKGRRGRKPCAERAAEAEKKPDQGNRRPAHERAAEKERGPGSNKRADNSRRTDNKDKNRRSGPDRRPRGERATGSDNQRGGAGRGGNERRADKDRRPGQNRRPDNKRQGEGSRRPDKTARTDNKQRPDSNRRPDNNRRADNNRRSEHQKRSENTQKPDDKGQS